MIRSGLVQRDQGFGVYKSSHDIRHRYGPGPPTHEERPHVFENGPAVVEKIEKIPYSAPLKPANVMRSERSINYNDIFRKRPTDLVKQVFDIMARNVGRPGAPGGPGRPTLGGGPNLGMTPGAGAMQPPAGSLGGDTMDSASSNSGFSGFTKGVNTGTWIVNDYYGLGDMTESPVSSEFGSSGSGSSGSGLSGSSGSSVSEIGFNIIDILNELDGYKEAGLRLGGIKGGTLDIDEQLQRVYSELAQNEAARNLNEKLEQIRSELTRNEANMKKIAQNLVNIGTQTTSPMQSGVSVPPRGVSVDTGMPRVTLRGTGMQTSPVRGVSVGSTGMQTDLSAMDYDIAQAEQQNIIDTHTNLVWQYNELYNLYTTQNETISDFTESLRANAQSVEEQTIGLEKQIKDSEDVIKENDIKIATMATEINKLQTIISDTSKTAADGPQTIPAGPSVTQTAEAGVAAAPETAEAGVGDDSKKRKRTIGGPLFPRTKQKLDSEPIITNGLKIVTKESPTRRSGPYTISEGLPGPPATAEQLKAAIGSETTSPSVIESPEYMD